VWVSSKKRIIMARVWGLLSLACALTISGKAQESEITTLGPTSSIQRQINHAQQHTYRVSLDANQYVRMTITAEAGELGVTLYGPAQQKFTETVCQQAISTHISLLTEAATFYLLEIRSLETEEFVGRYEIEVAAARPATATDRTVVLAERAYAEGERLRAEQREDAYRKATEKYEEARSHWHSLGEQTEEAATLKALGEIHLLLGEPKKTIAYYQQALRLAEAAKELRMQSELLSNLGYALTQVGENLQAQVYCGKALQLSQERNDARGLGVALIGLGDVFYSLGDRQQALAYYQQALAHWQALKDRRGLARVFLLMGYIHDELSDAERAVDYYNQSLRLWRAVNDYRGQALVFIAMGNLYANQGNQQEALRCYDLATPLLRTLGDPVWQASILANTAEIYRDLGEMDQALESFGQALKLCEAASYWRGYAQILRVIGEVYFSKGDHQKALAHFQQALAIHQETAEHKLEPYVLKDLGDVSAALGKPTEALEYYNRALVLFRASGSRRGEANALRGIGHVYESLNDQARAFDYYSQALSLNRATIDLFSETKTLYDLAHLVRGRGNLSEARAYIEQSLSLIESLRIKAAGQETRAAYFATVQQNYELYVDLLMQQRKQRPQDGLDAAALHASERARARSLLESLIEARADIRQGVDPALLERERSLQQRLNNKAEQQTRLLGSKHTAEQVAAAAKEIEAITTDYQQVRAQIRTRSPRYAALTQPQPLTLKEIQQQVLDADTVLLEYALGDERSYLWAVTPDAMQSYELPKRAEIEKAARRVHGLLTAPNQVVKGETLLQTENRLARAEADYPQAAADLSRMLLGPVGALLGTKRLLVVPDGALQYISFAALPVPAAQGSGAGGQGSETKSYASSAVKAVAISAARITSDRPPAPDPRPLVADHEIISLPSASVLAVLRRELTGRKPAEKSVAVIADPVFSADDERLKSASKRPAAPRSNSATGRAAGSAQTRDFERALSEVGLARDGLTLARLSFSRREAEAIATAAPAGQAMKAIDFEASHATAISSDLSRYRIVHFATHGLLNSEHPELSGIVLSLVDQDGKPQNGFLRLHEIYNLNLPAELVVLSACQTGLGKEIKGEGLVGLTRGFMYAGAARVMASLWKVDDAATAELMKRLYGKMLQEGMRPAAALRAAQVEMWQQKRWRWPYYWAAFVLQGEWQ
jgi:CHAT domain-containing protein/tetratricopeptide (TPR) repeat protein